MSTPTAGKAVTGYRLWRQADAGTWAQLGADLAATATTHTDDTVTVNHAYRYWLQALGDAGPGVPAPIQALAVITPAAVPGTVQNLSAVATATALQLTWDKASRGGLPAAYRVEWRPSGSDPFQEVLVAGTTQAVSDLRPATAYELRVTAYNQAGAATAATQTPSTLDAAPGTPTTLTVAVTGNAATATWEEPADGCTAPTL